MMAVKRTLREIVRNVKTFRPFTKKFVKSSIRRVCLFALTNFLFANQNKQYLI